MAKILEFPSSVVVRERGKNPRCSRQNYFRLGTIITVNGRIGVKAHYTLQRCTHARFWRLNWCHDEKPPFNLLHMTTLTPEEVIPVVANLGFTFSMADWIAMGWRPSLRPQSAKLIYVNPSDVVRKPRRPRARKATEAHPVAGTEAERGTA